MSHVSSAPLFVTLARQRMVTGVPAWPQADTVQARQAVAKHVLHQALADVLGQDPATVPGSVGSTAESVASALLNALGSARWSLRSGHGTGDILGRF